MTDAEDESNAPARAHVRPDREDRRTTREGVGVESMWARSGGGTSSPRAEAGSPDRSDAVPGTIRATGEWSNVSIPPPAGDPGPGSPSRSRRGPTKNRSGPCRTGQGRSGRNVRNGTSVRHVQRVGRGVTEPPSAARSGSGHRPGGGRSRPHSGASRRRPSRPAPARPAACPDRGS